MILEPLESVNSQLVFFMIDRYLHDSDRYNRICGMYLNACMAQLLFTRIYSMLIKQATVKQCYAAYIGS